MGKIETAREVCTQLIGKHDRSSLILSKYVPQHSINGWLAIRALAVDTAKVVDNMREYPVSLARLQFWKAGVQQLQNPQKFQPNDPATLQLLRHAVHTDKSAIHKRYLLTLLQTREVQLQQKPIRKIDDLARFGEGSYSQVLYATLDMLQAQEPGTPEFLAAHANLDETVSEIVAHIGQATGIASAVKTLAFYASRQNRIILPAEILQKYGLADQAIIDGFEHRKLPAELKDAVFEVSTAANDHLLAARSKLAQLKEQTHGKVPPSLVITSMAAVPIQLYLERLQGHDFDVTKETKEWKLPWRSWRAYRNKAF